MKTPPSSSPYWKVFNLMTRVNTVAYRATGGKVGGRMGKAPVLLLHHVGAKSGTERVAPLNYLDVGDGTYAVVASKGGTDEHPAWYHNLRANPETEVEIGREKIPVRARVAPKDERAKLWVEVLKIWPPYADYQRQTERTIPVVVLEPR